jgi:hypothetical protein
MKTRSQKEYGTDADNRLNVLATVALQQEVYMVDYHEMAYRDGRCYVAHMGLKIYEGYLLEDILEAARKFAKEHGAIIMGTYHKVHGAPAGGYNFERLGNKIFTPV